MLCVVTGAYGASAANGSQRIAWRRCTFTDISAGAVMLGDFKSWNCNGETRLSSGCLGCCGRHISRPRGTFGVVQEAQVHSTAAGLAVRTEHARLWTRRRWTRISRSRTASSPIFPWSNSRTVRKKTWAGGIQAVVRISTKCWFQADVVG